MRFVKEKVKKAGSGFRLIHSAEATTVNLIEEIEKRLSQIKTPILLEDFENAIIASLSPLCGNKVDFEWDENPYVRVKELDEDEEYRLEYHIDTLVCGDRLYELHAVYEFYISPSETIIQSFEIEDISEVVE
jgi:hypothetical protein